MKKIIAAVFAISAVLLLASCGSTKTTAATQAEELNLPAWVLEGKRDNTGIYAVGAGKLSNLTNSLKMAKAQARVELATTVKANVQAVTQTLVDDQGATGDRQDLEALTENALIRVDTILQGSEQVDQFIAKDETVYVLMYLPYSTMVTELNKNLEETNKKFNRTSSAAYTEQKMAEAYEKYFSENKN
ncbi:MAG: LPP20 family lipoprotein [Treponema sp.]|nr:LPP20 family lipoprotein [Treponema sp.]MBR0486712.1 LPP20 family lipoprotein [Treponema sp.]